MSFTVMNHQGFIYIFSNLNMSLKGIDLLLLSFRSSPEKIQPGLANCANPRMARKRRYNF